MNEQSHGVLTREELDALLVGFGDERGNGDREWSGSPFRRGASTGASEGPHASLRRVIENFARLHSRQISNLYQSRITFELMNWRELRCGEVAATMLPADRIATFVSQPSGAIGFIWFGRPLLFSLLCLNFGARPGGERSESPNRPYTGVEERVYQRSAQEILAQLELSWKTLVQTTSRVGAIEGPGSLLAIENETMLLATIDVMGLGDICRLRIALPQRAFADLSPPDEGLPSRQAAIEDAITDMTLDLGVEVGSVAMSLADLSRLHAGQLIPISAAEDGNLLVRVAGEPKFLGIPGKLGRKLAVQLTQRL